MLDRIKNKKYYHICLTHLFLTKLDTIHFPILLIRNLIIVKFIIKIQNCY
jgi:hypothetical protein